MKTMRALLWLDVDPRICEASGVARSLDDFACAFFGVEDGRVAPLLYEFDDVVAALALVQPFDWRALLRERLDSVVPPRCSTASSAAAGVSRGPTSRPST